MRFIDFPEINFPVQGMDGVRIPEIYRIRQIYESDERYIFVALYKPDKPRDAEEDYNYKYLYYTFWVDKGNYLTDALKLRKTLVNVFGDETGLNIEKEIKEQQR